MGKGFEIEYEVFLFFWLLRCVFFVDDVFIINKRVFLIVVFLVKGIKIVLVFVVFVFIYRDLRLLKEKIVILGD